MKKYINTISFAKLTVLVFTLFTTLVSAQTDLPDAPEDTTPAPIGDYLWALAAVGLVFVFLRMRARTQQRKTV